ncbi:DUF2269 family protein [uncultured Chloroflexus sp.]|uniref:DUF2269 family protein n=1 Tax=uncultured Chloroflexus sp. TaxID=214040 RepID=UPI00263788A4|nr:DUF2269 family protein [uncultured Chloroflexus sp.]
MHPPPKGAQPFIYTLLVFLHILAAMTAVGLNASYAIWITHGTRNPASLPFAPRGVKFIDDYVANPCHLIGGVTGALMIAGGKSVAPLLWMAIALSLVARTMAYGLYTPLLSRQIKMLEATSIRH